MSILHLEVVKLCFSCQTGQKFGNRHTDMRNIHTHTQHTNCLTWLCMCKWGKKGGGVGTVPATVQSLFITVNLTWILEKYNWETPREK